MPTNIEWTDETWNPVTGCTKVSDGCKNCYAERLWPRLKTGRPFTEVKCHQERLKQPLHWRKPRRVFVNSMSDLFHEDLPDEFIAAVFGVMAACPQHTFQVLTKRSKWMIEWFAWISRGRFGADLELLNECAIRLSGIDACYLASENVSWPLPNVTLMASVEDQPTADERIPLLLQTPAAVRGMSLEPLLGPVDLRYLHYDSGISEVDALGGTHGLLRPHGGECARLDWVIVGGESGPKARPMHPDWVRGIRDQCVAAGVPFFFKGWGEWAPDDRIDPLAGVLNSERTPTKYVITLFASMRPIGFFWPDGQAATRIGKKAAGRKLDGRTWDQFP